MDALDQEIGSCRAKLAGLESSVIQVRVRLDALVYAASLRPASTVGEQATRPEPVQATPIMAAVGIKKPGGKPPGQLSGRWKEILSVLYGEGPVSYAQIKSVADSQDGQDADLSSIRDRVRSIVRMGFIERASDGNFVVTDLAAQRFAFRKNDGPKGLNVIEPLNGKPVSGSIGEGYQPSFIPNPA